MSLLLTMSMLFLCLSVLPSLSQLAYSQTSGSSNILPILSSSSFKDTLGSLHVVGELKNNSTDPFDFVKVVSTFYDSTGKVVGTDFTYSHIKVLRPWERSSFELILSDAQQSDKVNNPRPQYLFCIWRIYNFDRVWFVVLQIRGMVVLLWVFFHLRISMLAILGRQ